MNVFRDLCAYQEVRMLVFQKILRTYLMGDQANNMKRKFHEKQVQLLVL